MMVKIRRGVSPLPPTRITRKLSETRAVDCGAAVRQSAWRLKSVSPDGDSSLACRMCRVDDVEPFPKHFFRLVRLFAFSALDGASLVPTIRKPFDVLAEGLVSKESGAEGS